MLTISSIDNDPPVTASSYDSRAAPDQGSRSTRVTAHSALYGDIIDTIHVAIINADSTHITHSGMLILKHVANNLSISMPRDDTITSRTTKRITIRS